jgi:hypothetical protein
MILKHTFSLAPAAYLALSAALLFAATTTRAATIAQWSFPDQGATANADLSATTVHANASAGAITLGSGYTQLVQIVGGTNYTYVDAAQVDDDGLTGIAQNADGSKHLSSQAAFFVGDWASDDQDSNYPSPSNSGPGGNGALYVLDSPGETDGGVAEALSNNYGLTFDVTASGGNWEITDFTFYGSGGVDGRDNRQWVWWHLQVDTGSGFTPLFTSAEGVFDATEVWALQEADPFSVTIADGETATFLLIGQSNEISSWGRGNAFDDFTLEGTFTIPEPASLVLIGLGSMLIASRRSRKACLRQHSDLSS